jgi:hypothetical protein
MSYDLMVFDPATAPRARSEFLTWYRKQTEWAEDHDYNDPAVCTPHLRAFFEELISSFPPMNGPYASDDIDDDTVTDYSVGRSVIYAAFAWSQQERARAAMVALAQKHEVGFFDVSATDGDVVYPPEPKVK